MSRLTKSKWILAGIIILITLSLTYILQPQLSTALQNRSLKKEQEKFQNDRQPATVINNFYNWYLAYDGNPMADRAYQGSTYLTERFKNQIDSLRYSYQFQADPFLCAQDKPTSFSVGLVEVGNSRVSVETFLNFSNSIRSLLISLEKTGDTWLIDQIKCGQNIAQNPSADKTAIIYFSNSAKEPDDNTDCGLTYGVERNITYNSADEYLVKSLQELFKGPTPSEIEQGYTSFFSADTADILTELKIENGTVYLNLKDIRPLIPNASTSCGSQSLLAQIEETIKHTREFDRVIITIDKSAQTFYDWIQFGCQESNNFCQADVF